MLPHMLKIGLVAVICDGSSDGVIMLDYLGGPNVIIKVCITTLLTWIWDMGS